MKDYKFNIGYFTKWDGGENLGLGIMAAGLAYLFFAHGYINRIIGAVIAAIGLGLFFVLGSGKSREKDIREEVDRRSDIYIDLSDDRHYIIRIPETVKEYVFRGYDFCEGLYLKRMKNGDLCSSRHTAAKVQVLKDAFYVVVRTFSLTSDEEREEIYDIRFDTIESLAIEKEKKTLTSGKNTFEIKDCHLVITYDGGKRLALPKKDDIFNDDLLYELNMLRGKNGK